MLDPQQALAAAARRVPAGADSRHRVLVLGGGGALGAAVLEQLLGGHRFERVGVAVLQPLSPALRGLVTVGDAQWAGFGADIAVIVFDRERHANGRDDAFLRPEPAQLPALAQRLLHAGARRLVVAVPHAPSLLPQALQRGLASMDEGAVAALGFEQLVFLRMAQQGDDGAAPLGAPQRLARWMLSQLRWMIPQHEQPVRGVTVARVIAQLALLLPQATPGSRVLPAALLWHAAQGGDAGALVQGWLDGRPLPDVPAQAPARRRW
jgi:hypothetical protein